MTLVCWAHIPCPHPKLHKMENAILALVVCRWDLSGPISGNSPSPRLGAGFAAADGVLYSFGGYGANGL